MKGQDNQVIYNTSPWSPWDDDLNQLIKIALNEVVNEGVTNSSEDIWDIALNLQYPYMDEDWQKEYDDIMEIKNTRKRILSKVRHFSEGNKGQDWLVHVTHDGGFREAIDRAWDYDKQRREKHRSDTG